ncbi:MAG: UvrD-helicase domain-containing protein [Phycisphaerae bacterium]|jgi:DNA helicase-2/ATP-dependent DNA helicase PcrA|nr:UvrD-helicase domain-containing protein [Phycisphaerae bacterium]
MTSDATDMAHRSSRLSPEDILDGLTPAQRSAASVIDGAVLVLAGPGSGKTRVITRRIAHLVANGIPAWQILALTFTNKAAGEMRDRVERLVSASVPGRRGLTVSTFHSFCALLLRRYGGLTGLKDGFSIYDTGDQRDAMKEALEESGLSSANFTPAAALAIVSNAKNALQDAEAFAKEATDFHSRSIAKAYKAYERILLRNNAVDFDDLLLKVAQLLRQDINTLRELQARYRYILIDEYQDTNHAQFVIAHALAQAHGNLFVVGDPDQSIYGWRGADLSNILDFEEHFPNATVIPLGQNFRSTAHIVRCAAAVIENNRRRKHKELTTELGDGERPLVAYCTDEHDEAVCAADFLLEASEAGVEWRRMAVLYRMNSLSRVIEDELRRRSVPYVVARGTAFWDRKEVKDVLAYLRAIANSADETAVRRIINVPTRGIGDTSVRKLQALAMDAGVTLGEFMTQGALRGPSIANAVGRSAKAILGFGALLGSWRERFATSAPGDLAPLVADVLRESGLDAIDPLTAGEEEREAKQNRDEIVSAVSEWRLPADVEESGEPPQIESALDALRGFLATVALVSDQDLVDADRGAVTLLTLHAAKGLEFDTVALIGAEQGILPHQRANQEPDGIEEERRLCFVGMTRAERRLLISCASMRVIRGIRQGAVSSEFLRELPESHVRVERRDRGSPDDFSGIVYDEPDAWGDAPVSKRYPVGCTVRHPLFGVGRVEQVVDRGASSSVRVAFRTVGIKTLVLAYAKLERLDG